MLAVTDRSAPQPSRAPRTCGRPRRSEDAGAGPAGVPRIVVAVPADVAGALLGPAVGVRLAHVVEQPLDALGVGDVLQHRGAAFAGRLDGERARADDPLPERLAVGDVGDPAQPDVAAAPGQDALPEQ